MMRILVAGGAGFIGRNFIMRQMKNEDVEILNFDILTYAGNLETLKPIQKKSNYEFMKGDICSHIDVRNALESFKPNILINFAAESHVDRSIDGPLKFIETNVVGTSILLNESLKYFNLLNSKQKEKFIFIHISTDEVYGALDRDGFFTEKTSYAPNSPYSASKASSDHLVRAWNHTYGLPIIVTNCSNNYGPNQFPEKLIPLSIINCMLGKEIPVYGNGENIRDWLYVEDHCDALNCIILDGIVGETYNIGGNCQLKNIDVVRMICENMDKLLPRIDGGKYEDKIAFVKDRPGHDYRYAIDASKIKTDLGWSAKIKFSDGISKTIKWFVDNEEWWMKIYNNNYKQERLGLV